MVLSCHPFRVGIRVGSVTGGYASLTPGYHRLTRSGLIEWSRASARLGITQNPAGIHSKTPSGVI